MIAKSIIQPELRRRLRAPFAWIDRHFLLDGFLAQLSPEENLLYFFLVLAADGNGLSYYGYDKICRILKLKLGEYVKARDSLHARGLIAFDGIQFQVLRLPVCTGRSHQAPKGAAVQKCGIQQAVRSDQEAQSLKEIFVQLSGR